VAVLERCVPDKTLRLRLARSHDHPGKVEEFLFRSIARLRPHIARYRGSLIVSLIAFLVARLFEASAPQFLRLGIDNLAAGRHDILVPALGITVCVLARFVVVSFARFRLRRVGIDVAFDLRQQLFGTLQTQGVRFFNCHGIGDMMTRAISDIGLIRRLINVGFILIIILVYATVVGFAFMWYSSPILTLLILPPLPFVALYAWFASREMGRSSQVVQERLSALGDHVQENFSGIRTIQAMAQEPWEIKRFATVNRQYADAFYWQSRVNSQMLAIMPLMVGICMLIAIGYGGWLVLEDRMSIGTFVVFFFYINMVLQPVRAVGMLISLLQRGAIACRRLFEMLDREPEIRDAPNGRTPAGIRGEIRLSGVRYRYPGADREVLRGIDLTIRVGETIAIMGRVGAGKTTMLQILNRLLDTPCGMVRIDGFDLQDYPLRQVREQITLVMQDAFLFADTIGANISYDDPHRPDEFIWDAAAAADLDATIRRIPEKLQAMVGERGVTLSGGQKQRAALARGLIGKAPVLLLDDCFASVDTETEEQILTALRSLREGRTTLLVSHRISTARHADRILVLDEGRIVEIGTHEQLLARGGYYHDLERIQRRTPGPAVPAGAFS